MTLSLTLKEECAYPALPALTAPIVAMAPIAMPLRMITIVRLRNAMVTSAVEAEKIPKLSVILIPRCAQISVLKLHRFHVMSLRQT